MPSKTLLLFSFPPCEELRHRLLFAYSRVSWMIKAHTTSSFLPLDRLNEKEENPMQLPGVLRMPFFKYDGRELHYLFVPITDSSHAVIACNLFLHILFFWCLCKTFQWWIKTNFFAILRTWPFELKNLSPIIRDKFCLHLFSGTNALLSPSRRRVKARTNVISTQT